MSKKILIVDDEIKEYRKCKSILAPYSHDIKLFYAPHGPAALDRINMLEPDLILLDQQFKKDNVLRGNLFYKDKDKSTIVQHRSDDMVAEEHETKQGLYIIQKIRELGFQGWIVFLTAYAGDLAIATEALRLGGKENTDYISKDRLKPGNECELVKIIEQKLSLKLISMPQKIRNILIQFCGNIPKQEEGLIVDALVNSATVKRRRGLAFVETVLKRLKAEHKHISFNAFSSTMDLTDMEWKSEPVEPWEILNWVLSRLDYNELPKNEKEWNYIGRNTLRYIFQTTMNGKHIFLKIIHPKYSKEIISVESGGKYHGVFTVYQCTCFPLDESDPDWEGTHVVNYLEEGIAAKTLREYAGNLNEAGLMDANNIHSILTNIVSILKNLTNGHGMIDVDSIHYVNNSVWLADLMLWNYVNEEGKKMIEGIILDDRKHRDIQALGIIGNFLTFGRPEGIKLITSQNAFLSCLIQCLKGIWDLNNEIPRPVYKAQYFDNGPFISKLEREFSLLLKKEFLENNIDALVYFNTNVVLTPPIANEVDALVIRPGKVFWLDTKGNHYKDCKSKEATEMNQKIGKLKNLLKRIGLPDTYVSGYCIVRDSLYTEIESELTAAEKLVTRSYSQIVSEIKDAKDSNYALNSFRDKFKGSFYGRLVSPYEKSLEFLDEYGNVSVQTTKKLLSELNCNEKPYYIRRYSFDHSYDSIFDVPELIGYIREADREKKLIGKISCEYILLPDKIFWINSSNDKTVPLIEFEKQNKETKQIEILQDINPDIRWIYKVYKKPGKDFKCPSLLKDYVSDIIEDEKKKLLLHYLKAVDILLKNGSETRLGFNKDSLKVFKNVNVYVGVIEPILNHEIGKRDVLYIIDALNDNGDALRLYRNKVEISKENLDTIVENIIAELSSEYERKDKLDKIMEKVDKIGQVLSTSTNQDYGKKQSPVGKFQNHQEKKVEAESISIKPPEKQTQGRLEGTIKLLAFSVDFNSVNEEKRREQFRCDFINNIKNGQLVKIGYPKQSSGVYSGMIWILNEQQHNTAKDVQDVTIASEPIMEYGSIVFQGKGYMFRKDAISPEDLKGLHEGGKVSFILNKGDIVKDIKIIPS